MSKQKKPKKATVELIERVREADGQVREPYEIMEHLIASERADLIEAKIAIAWKMDWSPDADGQLTLGQCKKRNAIDRNLADYDFVILLNREAWPHFTPEQKARLIYHELTHAVLCTDDDGELKRDEQGRIETRIRKHNITEFREVVQRYGPDEDLSALVIASMADAQRPLLNQPPETTDDGSHDCADGVL